MVVWEKLYVSILFPICVSIPIFQKFDTWDLKHFAPVQPGGDSSNYRDWLITRITRSSSEVVIYIGTLHTWHVLASVPSGLEVLLDPSGSLGLGARFFWAYGPFLRSLLAEGEGEGPPRPRPRPAPPPPPPPGEKIPENRENIDIILSGARAVRRDESFRQRTFDLRPPHATFNYTPTPEREKSG